VLDEVVAAPCRGVELRDRVLHSRRVVAVDNSTDVRPDPRLPVGPRHVDAGLYQRPASHGVRLHQL